MWFQARVGFEDFGTDGALGRGFHFGLVGAGDESVVKGVSKEDGDGRSSVTEVLTLF